MKSFTYDGKIECLSLVNSFHRQNSWVISVDCNAVHVCVRRETEKCELVCIHQKTSLARWYRPINCICVYSLNQFVTTETFLSLSTDTSHLPMTFSCMLTPVMTDLLEFIALALVLISHRDPLLFVRSSRESVDVWWQLLIAREERENMQCGTTLVGVREVEKPHLMRRR